MATVASATRITGMARRVVMRKDTTVSVLRAEVARRHAAWRCRSRPRCSATREADQQGDARAVEQARKIVAAQRVGAAADAATTPLRVPRLAARCA